MQQLPNLIGPHDPGRFGLQRGDVLEMPRGSEAIEKSHEHKQDDERDREGDGRRKRVGSIGGQAFWASIPAVLIDSISNLLEYSFGKESALDSFHFSIDVENRQDQHIACDNIGAVRQRRDDDHFARNRGVACDIHDALHDHLRAIRGRIGGNAAQMKEEAAVDGDGGGFQRGRARRLRSILCCGRGHDPKTGPDKEHCSQEAIYRPRHSIRLSGCMRCCNGSFHDPMAPITSQRDR